MKIKKFVLVAAAAALLLTGCASTANPTKTVTVEPTYDDTIVASPEEIYLNAVHSVNNYYIENNTDADLVALGRTLCSTLDQGATVMEVVEGLVATGDYNDTESQEFAGVTIGAAVSAFCPEYSYQLN